MSRLVTGSWADDPPAALGRACRWCELVVTKGRLARWHGQPIFLCAPCAWSVATSEIGWGHLDLEGGWELGHWRTKPPWDCRLAQACRVDGCAGTLRPDGLLSI